MNVTGFYGLTPHVVLDEIENLGFHPTGLCIQLNSFENRVFDIGLEENQRMITKFYRPGRWSRAAIEEEHGFIQELKSEGIPAVAPYGFAELSPTDKRVGSPPKFSALLHTLFESNGIYFCTFPRIQGRVPQEFLEGELRAVGRRLAQVHNVGARKSADHRLTLNVETFGYASLEVLENWIWMDLRKRYLDLSERLLNELERRMAGVHILRIHGDCHKGNLLSSGSDFFFVDFDDMCNGPAVQDLWMLVGGESEDARPARDLILEGYEELRAWDESEWDLVPLLRAQRLIHYSAWIARRWEDPSFPRLFPDFNTYLYWLEETDELERIVAAVF